MNWSKYPAGRPSAVDRVPWWKPTNKYSDARPSADLDRYCEAQQARRSAVLRRRSERRIRSTKH